MVRRGRWKVSQRVRSRRGCRNAILWEVRAGNTLGRRGGRHNWVGSSASGVPDHPIRIGTVGYFCTWSCLRLISFEICWCRDINNTCGNPCTRHIHSFRQFRMSRSSRFVGSRHRPGEILVIHEEMRLIDENGIDISSRLRALMSRGVGHWKTSRWKNGRNIRER